MKIAVDCYYDSISKYNEALCGDQVIHSYDHRGFLCVLADGLGSGVKANILATLTATIMHDLLKADIELNEVIATVSASLPQCQERNIAYSTFSFIKMNEYGETVFVEFDNPAILIIRNQKHLNIQKEKLQYDNRIVYCSKLRVLEGDLVVMMSDGMLYAGDQQVLNNNWKEEDVLNHIIHSTQSNDDAQTIAQYVLSSVLKLYDNQPQDDATIVVCKIKAQRNSVVLVGPPKRMEDDSSVVDKLKQADGLKVVCGGTTAQIVARELNERVVVDDAYLYSGDLPPTARIDGVDFVSEGILTLGRLVDLLVEASENKRYLQQMLQQQAQDGAHQLFQLLLKRGTNITFYVGQAENKAYSYMAESLSLNMKNKLVHRIASYLKMFGKVVTIYYV